MALPTVLRGRWLAGLVILAALPVLLVVDQALGELLAGPRNVDLAGARWIWAPRVSSWSGPTAFLALRDLELPAAPAAASLVVLADEEYAFFVNGQVAGAGRYRSSAGLDAYDLAPLLRPGNNRLAVELRSGRGVGGFLARLRVDLPGRPPLWLVTDRDWQVSYRSIRKLRMGAEDPLPPLPRALELADPPFGRWGPRRVDPPRPLLADSLAEPRSWVRAWKEDLDGQRLRVSLRQPVRGERILVDFGREVTGFLVLEKVGQTTRPALVYVGSQPPHPDDVSPSAVWIPSVGASHWLDVEPRRFRYVLVMGPAGLRSADVYEIRQSSLAAWPPRPLSQARGVFGLPAVHLRSPVEDKIWSELQGLAGG